MTDRDEVTELADRLQARQQRGESWDLEFEIEFGGLTTEQRGEFIALMHERAAQGQEKLEAIEENNRILGLLHAFQQGTITAKEFVERVRGAVPDPLAE